jgi:uncharacterized protein GlcG (DUF336 family)
MAKLTLEQANTIIAHAVAHCREQKWLPMGVAVLDDSGNMISGQRDDGASMFRIDVGAGKAWAAVAIGMSSREVHEKAINNPTFFVSLASTAQGKFIPQTGAVLIKDAEGNVLGACGSSGAHADQDEAACIYGVEKAGFKIG